MKCLFRIEGRNVNLRTTTPSDMNDYDRWNDPKLKAWQYEGPCYTNDDLSAIIASRTTRLGGDHKHPHKFLEIETKRGIHIGWVVVYYSENDPHMTEIGINIPEEEHWGKGFGSEALWLWVDYLFRARELTRLGFSTWDGNKSIIAIGHKLGFTEEGRIRKGCEVNGEFYDRIKMGILKDEWKSYCRSGTMRS